MAVIGSSIFIEIVKNILRMSGKSVNFDKNKNLKKWLLQKQKSNWDK